MPRLFYGIDMPVKVKDEARNARRWLTDGGVVADSWTNADLLHITVLFIGMIDTNYLPDMVAAGEFAVRSMNRFSLRTDSLGVFPKNKILWLGLDDKKSELSALSNLHDTLIHQLETVLPVEFDKRPFRPHLTLARKLRDSSRIGEADSFPKMDIEVTELCLLESIRIGGVLQYPVRHRFKLGE